LLAGIVLGLVAAAPVEAQRGSSGRRGGGEQDRAELEQRVRMQMGRMMERRLGLTQEQATALSDVVQGFDERRREMRRSEQAARRRVEALLLEGGEDDTEARELLARMADLRQQEAALFAEEQEALLDVITPIQVLQMQALREQIGQRIRALRGRGGGQGRGQRGGSDGRGEIRGAAPGGGGAGHSGRDGPMWRSDVER
jgi:Spy/CpxP family protein refolding chaperone